MPNNLLDPQAYQQMQDMLAETLIRLDEVERFYAHQNYAEAPRNALAERAGILRQQIAQYREILEASTPCNTFSVLGDK